MKLDPHFIRINSDALLAAGYIEKRTAYEAAKAETERVRQNLAKAESLEAYAKQRVDEAWELLQAVREVVEARYHLFGKSPYSVPPADLGPITRSE